MNPLEKKEALDNEFAGHISSEPLHVGDEYMNSLNNIGSEDNKSICDGLGCTNEATHRIDEVIGDIGRLV